MIKRLISFVVLVVIAFSFSSCNSQVQEFSKTDFILNTVCTVTVYDKKEEKFLDGALQLCRNYEQMFSKTISGSDIDRINQSAPESVEVSPETAELLQLAVHYGEITKGMFDVTTGKLSTLWDFQSETPRVPSEEEIKQAVDGVDYRQIVVEGTRAALLQPDAEIDLGGIAKGYIADRLADYLRSNGVEKAVINLGGNILTLGSKSDTEKWKIGIQQPFAETDKVIGYVEVDERSVVTSGIYERSFVVDGKRYHHVLNPFTGYPVENDLSAVVVISKQSVQGDALSTSCLLLGREKGMKLIENTPQTEAIFISKDGECYVSSGIGTEIPFQKY